MRREAPLISNELISSARLLLEELRRRGLKLAAAESCTGGLLTALLTEIPGSSSVVERGFVTYSDAAKTELLGVDPKLIARNGAVSATVALAMAAGALANSPADLAVAVTGVAGPGGGSAEKPVGLVHLCAARRGGAEIQEEHRFGDIGRTEVRVASVAAALALLRRLLN